MPVPPTRPIHPHSPAAALRRVLLAVLAIGMCVGGSTSAAPKPTDPDALLAAFVYNFCLFTKWPNQGPAKPLRPLVIVTTGKPLPALAALAQRTIRKRPIRIAAMPTDGQFPEPCDVLVTNGLPMAERDSLLALAAQRPVLTLSRDPGFCQAGGIVEFFVAKDRMRFRISRFHMRRAGIRIRSRLLKLAEIVPAPTRRK
jgi:hypothetical protein